jgi:hypothetical protein
MGLEIDTATYCKREIGKRRVKRERIVTIGNTLKSDQGNLLILYIVDQVTTVVTVEKLIANKALHIVQNIQMADMMKYTNK